jgi:hypothetical protein
MTEERDENQEGVSVIDHLSLPQTLFPIFTFAYASIYSLTYVLDLHE